MTNIARPEMRGVNVILLNDGRELHLDDITTAAQGQAALDEMDAAIDKIEGQISAAREGLSENNPLWRRRAEIALKRKRRQRPRLQQKIGDLRRSERQAGATPQPGPERPLATEKRIAFIDAAEQMLEHELFTEIWARAREMRPAAFPEGGQP